MERIIRPVSRQLLRSRARYPFAVPTLHAKRLYSKSHVVPPLKDQSLFIEKAYVNGQWVDAQSGKTFEVHGKAGALPVLE
jgi:succinate-semialdehyde dehydrogenase/glutarate-semialdehyde dehydrogenase